MELKTGQHTTEIEHYQRLKVLEKKRKRQVREAQQKEDNHWKFIAGDLVAKYLKDTLKITVHKGAGAREKNRIAFQPLEYILAYLAAHQDFTTRIMQAPPDMDQHNSCLSGAYTHRCR
ncbi:hypothetical protein [Pseudoflavonifractor phocaeensis]|uniref:hypothetical protein n=1 Tax=Pseudoflavonifractor phocaeensis TaxID=1870988 RepID=UPI00195DF1B6|nr:hypothetical protein [Pseudoflavonifractor phocaeensis]MBM6723293.1 hypothetical protein [Pseudoflavonifractor phocaeensis]